MEIATQILAIICIVIAIAALLLLLWQHIFQHKQQKIHDDKTIEIVNVVDPNDFDRYMVSDRGQAIVANIIRKSKENVNQIMQ